MSFFEDFMLGIFDEFEFVDFEDLFILIFEEMDEKGVGMKLKVDDMVVLDEKFGKLVLLFFGILENF